MQWTAELRICVLAIALLTSVTHPAGAQSSNTPAATALFDHIRSKIEDIDRRNLARLVSNYCTEVLQALPRNSPREDDWVDGELSSGNWDRMVRAMQWVENTRKSLVSVFTDCISESTKLIRPSQPTAEAVLWTRVATTFSNSSIVEKAERLGLVKFDEKTGWVDPNLLKVVPISILFNAHLAVIESLGHKLTP
jgi:hypothetical protein